MTDRSVSGVLASAFARRPRRCASDSPPSPKVPIRRKSRRWQSVVFGSQKENMLVPRDGPWPAWRIRVSEEFRQWLGIVFDQILRPAGEVRQRRLVGVDAQVVVECGEQLTPRDRSGNRF